jgi:hypothetical protein
MRVSISISIGEIFRRAAAGRLQGERAAAVLVEMVAAVIAASDVGAAVKLAGT